MVQGLQKGLSGIKRWRRLLNSALELVSPINLREQLYNEYFEGWGCEDSEISAIAIHLEKEGIIKKTLVDSMWYHLWHQNACETDCFDKETYKKNVAYLENMVKKLI